MLPMLRALALLGLVATPARAQFAPEPPDLWRGPMHGATPATLKGGTVIDARALADLLAKQQPLAIDVANLEHRPEDRPADQLWMPIHRSVPGASWLPGAGSGTRDPAFADAFAKWAAAATGGDKGKPIDTFCHPERWGSWNAAKRLTELGYTHVYWYPGGSEGWSATAATRVVREDPHWKAAGFDKDSSLTLEPKAAGK